MHIRLLSFFETSIVRRSLETLLHIQGFRNFQVWNFQDEHDNMEEPIVSIQVDEVQDDIQLPSGSSISLLANVQSTSAPMQPPQIYQISSLISALLASILHNVHVDCDAIERQIADPWYYLIRLLRFILDFKMILVWISCK
ncbi:hypothetical protein BDQ17DRAFT_364423 [Cyathus striatus]|nr:hypothetical protein BDQ17DRAFT_364423 [Cyathus striatus]